LETPQLFDEIATHYERWSNFLSAEGIRAWHHFAVERLAMQTGQTILDVGCGTGAITTRLAAKTGPTGHVTGLDPSRSMLNKARQRPRHPNDAPIQWVEGRGEALPFADAQFDRVTAQFSLRNMEDWIRGFTR
jgi:demethylmenaquinone methyltransferase/2-methoxy-6-polyprenyl-1,4-benzoquinol methylase